MTMLGVLSHDALLRQQAQAHLQAQRWAQAQECLAILVAMDPHDPWAQQWRVVVALALGQPQQALAAAQAALQALPPTATEARAGVLYNQGQAHGQLGQPAQALAAFDESLALQPGQPQVELGRAKALAQLGQHGQEGQEGQEGRAVTQALQADPKNLDALALMANTLVKAGAPAKALQAFAQHERTKPAAPFIACMVVFLQRQLADWAWPGLPINAEEGAHLRQALAQSTAAPIPPELALLAYRARQGMPAIEPFAGLVLYDDPALQRQVAEGFLRHLHPPVPVPPDADALLPTTERPFGPLRVAYVSNEFKEHATSYLLAGVLARHHPASVDVYLLSFAPPNPLGPDPMQQRLATMGHTWVDVHDWSDAEVARWCRTQHIDVAVDLKGLTSDSRPGIFAHRAAPVQVNWLGYPGTLPAPYYDWILADAQVLPPELEPHFAERVWRLPHSYQPHDPARPMDQSPQRRADHGLPDDAVVLVCFSSTFKITPTVWAVWMRLLLARSDAVLWLLAASPEAQAHLRGHAQAAGVNPDRLVFAPKLAQAQHMARLRLADLSLDTWPYNAHTTASDALWSGVPHVAYTGHSFATRVGSSVLTAANMPELITHGPEAYEALALRLLTDDVFRRHVKELLQARRVTAPLWNARLFADQLEAAFIGMVQVSSGECKTAP